MSDPQLRVLAVDDVAAILRFLVSALTAQGCETSAASTAEQALELLSQQSYDLVISDINMPGLSGLDLLRAVKSKQPDTPVVLITGAPSVDSAVFGLRHGAYDYLAKPFSAKEVGALIHRLREDRQPGQGRVGYPAGLAEDLARKQLGVEVLLRIGDLALQGLAPAEFLDIVLRDTMRGLGGDAALVLLRNDSGEFSSSHHGDPELVKHLLARLQACFAQLLATDGRQTLTLSEPNDPRMALAALVPGVDGTMGVLCLGRNGRAGAFLPDEKELLLAYAQNSALALQKLALRETAESNLVNTIAAFVNAIESKDYYLKGHSARVSLYAGEIATVMGMPHDEVLVVCRGGILHDLGKLAILDPILSKPGRLTPEEYELVKAHTEVGDKILKPLGFLCREAKAVRHHHERYDGKGYPDKLAGDDIPLIARVVAVADAFDAMTSDRAYRKALPFETAIAQIEQGVGTQFDPVAARAFLSVPRARLLEISGYWAASLETVAAGG